MGANHVLVDGRRHAHGCSHGGHGRHVDHVGSVNGLWRWWRRLFGGVKIISVILQLFLGHQRLTILLGLMDTTVPDMGLESTVKEPEIENKETYWARLSEREKALLQYGQGYGRSCV